MSSGASHAAESFAGRDVGEFLKRVEEGAKITSEILKLSRRQIHTDEQLRDSLSNSSAMMQEWEMSSKILGDRLREEVSSLCNQLAVAKHSKHRLLVDKRKLQMSIMDLKKKRERSEEQLNEIIAKYDCLAQAQKDEKERGTGTVETLRAEKEAAEKRVVALAAMVTQLREEASDDKKKDQTIDELREKVASLMTEVEEHRENAADGGRGDVRGLGDKKGSFAESTSSTLLRGELSLANLQSRTPHQPPHYRKGTSAYKASQADDVMSIDSSVPPSVSAMYRPASVRKLKTSPHSKQAPFFQQPAFFAGIAGGGVVALVVALAASGRLGQKE